MVGREIVDLFIGVRFPVAPPSSQTHTATYEQLIQLVECITDKDEIVGSSPTLPKTRVWFNFIP